MGKCFVSVWSDDQIECFNPQTPTFMGEKFRIDVTTTILSTNAWDRWLQHRQELGQ